MKLNYEYRFTCPHFQFFINSKNMIKSKISIAAPLFFFFACVVFWGMLACDWILASDVQLEPIDATIVVSFSQLAHFSVKRFAEEISPSNMLEPFINFSLLVTVFGM